MVTIIEFKSKKEFSEFYNPNEDELEEVEIEIRHDPLTGKTSRIIQKPFPIAEDSDMSDVEKDSFCPMCSENIYDVGARDTRVLDKKLGEKGEAVLMANITPYAEYSLVCRLAKDHYLELDEFEVHHFSDAFELLSDYLGKVKEKGDVKYSSIIMNYLKPAGSSIVHPHMQMLISDQYNDLYRRRYEEGRRFYEKHGESYWEVFVREDNERRIGKIGDIDWFSAFSPQGFEHIKGIYYGEFLEIDAEDLAKGMINVLRTYKDLNYNSFNISVFVPPLNQEEGFATVVDMVTRSNLDRFYWSDVSAINKLQDEPLTNRKPEKIISDYKKRFD
ncbi:MAG: hypothetical protein ACOC5D_06605 [Thermoplasmatota archaeon]